jgi:hypothetical protein
MSIGNKLGNNNQTSDLDNIVVDQISTRSLLQPIAIKGDLDFESAGSIGGVLSIETGNLNSLGASVASLAGNDISFIGNVSVAGTLEISDAVLHKGDLDVLGNLTVSGATNADGGLNVSGGNLDLSDPSSYITFGASTAVRVGEGAGEAGAGADSVAVGLRAGQTVLDANSIVINATGADLPTTGANQCHVAPIRGVAHGVGVGLLVYDPASGEITYSTS